MNMERLTKNVCGVAHGAEGTSENRLTGCWCRGEFEATAIVERLYVIEDILGDEYDLDRLRELVQADRKKGNEETPAINTNKCVWFKLSDSGEEFIRKYVKQRNYSLGLEVYKGYIWPNENGYFKAQLWEFMQILGKEFRMGKLPPIFPNNLYFECPEKEEAESE